MVRTNIPMIDLFNCLVKSQKIPIFSQAGEPYNQLLMRLANQTDADIVIIGGMGLRYDDYLEFIDNAERSGSMEKTVMFAHLATDPQVECLLVPDMALAVAEQFAAQGKDVLVLLTDMTAFADAIKEILISMDQIPSNRGYPGSLYSDLAARYEKAVDIDGSGSQFFLNQGRIDPFGSLSRLKQQVIGSVTREDHGDLANTLIRLYAESKKSKERQSMGFKLSRWDQKLIHYAQIFEKELMDLQVNIPIEKALDLGWKMLASCFDRNEVGIKQAYIEKYWPKTA
jgi:V/A-type H+-transporting ATPase subunit B